MRPPVGVVLAGGLARRMGGGDKSLLMLHGRTLLNHVIARVSPQVSSLILNANGDIARFTGCGLAVVTDPVAGYPGPLAGVLAGLLWARAHCAETLLSVPADTPFLPPDLVTRLQAGQGGNPVIAVAEAAGRRQPVVALWPVALADILAAALANGVRAVEPFTQAHGAVAVSFADAHAFFNINRPDDLLTAERMPA